MPPPMVDPNSPQPWLTALAAVLQNRNLNAYALIAFGGVAFLLKMPESIYSGLILGGLAVLKAGG